MASSTSPHNPSVATPRTSPLKKLAEGGSNRILLVNMNDGFQMIARLQYSCLYPTYYAIASEVATMDLLRASGMPVPEVYGYSADSDNEVET